MADTRALPAWAVLDAPVWVENNRGASGRRYTRGTIVKVNRLSVAVRYGTRDLTETFKLGRDGRLEANVDTWARGERLLPLDDPAAVAGVAEQTRRGVARRVEVAADVWASNDTPDARVALRAAVDALAPYLGADRG